MKGEDSSSLEISAGGLVGESSFRYVVIGRFVSICLCFSVLVYYLVLNLHMNLTVIGKKMSRSWQAMNDFVLLRIETLYCIQVFLSLIIEFSQQGGKKSLFYTHNFKGFI